MSDSNLSSAQRLDFRHIIGVLLILAMALWLCACSATKLAYQNAPELGYWWLDSYFDFNDSQSLRLREDLAALQTWHRKYELPVYVKTLEKLQKVAPLDATPEQFCDLYAEVKTHMQAVLDQFEPTVSAMAPALKPAQVDHLGRQLDKRRQKWRDDWLEATPAGRQNRRVKQLTERIETFYGRLDEPQLAVLRAGLLASPFDVNLIYRESQQRQKDIVQTLRQIQGARPGAPELKTAMRSLLVRFMESPDPVYRNYMETMTHATCRTLASLHNSSTPAQRQHLFETLKDYQADARSLLLPTR